MSDLNQMYSAIDDTDESLKGKSMGGAFGLNGPVFLTTFEYNPNGDTDGGARNVLDITITYDDREFRNRIFEVLQAYNQDNVLIDSSDPNFSQFALKEFREKGACAIHALKAVGVTQDEINTALSTPVADFVQWANILVGLLPADFATKPLDTFLEYQWDFKGDNDRTYLQLPKNMKGGTWLCPHVPGAFSPSTDSKGGLVYKDEQGREHPFHRDRSFMQSNKAKLQEKGSGNSSSNAQFTENGAAPKKTTTW